jgi:hypothetical protein
MKNGKPFFITILFTALLSACDDPPEYNPGNGNNEEQPCYQLQRVVNEELTDEELLDKVQQQTLKYFWDFAEPNSGMARERNTSGNLVTTGGTGFGIMAMLAGVHRGFLEREEVRERVEKICNFLEDADRFHGAWSHWINGTNGNAIAFSSKDDGGDLVETAFLVQGLIAAREFFDQDTPEETALREHIDELWHGIEWDFYTQGENRLYWHWSPNFGFEMNMPITGWNEAMIIYVLAAASPTYPIAAEVYHQGWARNGGMVSNNQFYYLPLPLGHAYGGPLFFAHYSFLGLDPRGLHDQYADYWLQNRNHSLINYNYAIENPLEHCMYSDSIWGITASDDPIVGYQAHAPYNHGGQDNGTITPTAALSSMPYTPEESMKALKTFYYYLYNDLWGTYGFKDAFNLGEDWFANSYLAIDQGPIVVMIENHRSGIIWDTFMKNEEVNAGLEKLGFYYENVGGK